MRITFVPPSSEEFNLLFRDDPIKRGGELGDISVYVPPGRAIKGDGLFSIMAGLAKRAVPFLIRTIISKELNLSQNIVGDINSGTLNRSNLKKRGLESLHNVGRRIVKGGRRKRSAKKKRTVNRKKY